MFNQGLEGKPTLVSAPAARVGHAEGHLSGDAVDLCANPR
jgi:hypothetical protein